MIPPLDPDPAVPQRDLLLDRDLLAGRLGRLLGVESIEECRQLRVKYRVGARLRVVYRIRVGAATVDVAASTFPTLERSERAYAEARARAVPCGRVQPVALDRGLRAVFWTFPNDRKIANLPAVARPAAELGELLPAWSRSALASYAPEKAATVRCLDENDRTVAYAKVYAGEEGERASRVHETLARALPADDAHLRLPRVLAYSARHRALIVEPVEGVRLEAFGYRRLGRALARLHTLAPPDGGRFRRADPDRIEAAAELIASVRRDVATEARSLAREISCRLDPDGHPVCLHGDVNFRNALLENGRVALIDLDQVAAGTAAAELGSVLASLRYAGVIGLLRPAVVPELCAALLSGYSELRETPRSDATRAHTAAALLAERSLRVVTRVRPEGLRRLPALLAAAREELE